MFQVVLGAIAVFVASTLQRRPVLSEQTLPILHDVSNELFDAHGIDELARAVGRLAVPLNASSTWLFVQEDDRFVQLPRDVEGSGAGSAPAAQMECPRRLLEEVVDRARPLFAASAPMLVADIPLCRDWIDRHRVRSLAAIPVYSEGAVAVCSL